MLTITFLLVYRSRMPSQGGRFGFFDVHRIDSSVDNLDNLIKDNERRLQTSQLNKSLHSPGICLATPLHLLTTLAQTRHGEVVVALGLVSFEGGEQHTRDVFLLRADAESRRLGRLLDLVTDVSADGVCDFGEGERGDLHDAAHLALGLVDSAGDFYDRRPVLECLLG